MACPLLWFCPRVLRSPELQLCLNSQKTLKTSTGNQQSSSLACCLSEGHLQLNGCLHLLVKPEPPFTSVESFAPSEPDEDEWKLKLLLKGNESVWTFEEQL